MPRIPFLKPSPEEISRLAMEAYESVLSEMGADIHDDLVQQLSVLRLKLDKIERSSFEPQETRDLVLKMQADFQRVIESVRRISRRLSPVKTDADSFRERVETLCQDMDTPGTVRIYPEFLGEPANLPAKTETYLLRMIQELIHNAIRHSAAWHVWVRVKWDSGVIIEVEDDGSGFSRLNEFMSKLRQKHNSLRMRATVIGAKVNYENGHKGLRARILLPI